LPDGRTISYCGPFWRSVGVGGHSVQFDATRGLHAMGYEVHGQAYTDFVDLVHDIQWWISTSSLVFAWIDSREAYGTLVEVGFAARVKGVVRVVAMPEFDRELWLASAFADRLIVAPTAGMAWQKLWDDPDCKDPSHPCKTMTRSYVDLSDDDGWGDDDA
jgi:hypothetical protein